MIRKEKEKRNLKFLCIVLALVLFVEAPYAVSTAYAQEDESVNQEPDEIISSEETVETNENAKEIAVKIKSSNYSKKTVELEWDSVDSAFEYVVFREKDGGWIECIHSNETVATINIDTYGQKNKIKVCSYQMDGELNGESSVINILIPAKIKNLYTTAYSKTKAILSWEKAKGANAYRIYKKKSGGKYSLLKTIKKTKMTIGVDYNTGYQFKVVPIFKSSEGIVEGSPGKVSFKNKEYVSIAHQKYTYSEMCQDIKSLCKTYSGYVSFETIGESEKGRKIYDVILGNPEADNTVLVISAIHGREYITTAVCMKQLEYYLMNYNKTVDGKKISDVFSNCNVHYVMMANPDGVTISQTSVALWKGNANGVNLNLNFPYNFKRGGKKKDNSYTGKKAASESETKAIIKLTKKLNKTQKLAVINYHAMGRIVFGDYNGKDSSLRSDINKMYRIARNTTGYASSSGYGGKSNGNYRSYLIYDLGVPSITLEIGSISCPVPRYQYATEFKRNKLVLLREASWLSNKKK